MVGSLMKSSYKRLLLRLYSMGNKHSLNGISDDNNNNEDDEQPKSVNDLDTRQKWALFKGKFNNF